MSIRWPCKCGQPLEVPDDHPQRVVTCPKCIRSIAVPFPEEPLSPDARRYLKGAENRGDTKKMSKPIKCTYCGWLIWQVGVKECPKCLRPIEQSSIVTTIVGVALLVILSYGTWVIYKKLSAGGAEGLLGTHAQALVRDLGTEWKRVDKEEHADLEPMFPAVFRPERLYEARTHLEESKLLGTVDGRLRARMTYTVTLFEIDPSKLEDDPTRAQGRGVATVEQKMVWKSDAGRWVPDGDPTVVDRKM